MTTLVHRDGTSLFNELMSWMGSPATGPEIRVEEYLDQDRRVIRADLPGVDPEKDITLTIEGDLLRLRGQRRAEEHDEHRTEIRYGAFERVMRVPYGTKPDDLTAEYVDGVLTVSMPATGSMTSTSVPVHHRETPVE
jgi:HSP20 family protein